MATEALAGRIAQQSLGKADFLRLDPAGQISAIRSSKSEASVPQTLRLILMLGRPRTCIPGLFSYALAVGYADAKPGFLLLLGAFLSFLVGFSANLHNTYTDLEEDSRNLPGRLWLIYLLGYRRLRSWLVALNAVMAGSALLYGVDFFLFVVVGLIALHQYSFRPARLKSRPVLGLTIFSMATVGPFLIGWFGLGGGVRPPDPKIWSVVVFLFVWFTAKGLFKNTPDYYGDKEAGLRTSATVFPSWRGAATATTIGTLTAYLCYPLLLFTGAIPVGALASLVLLPLVVVQCVRLVRADDGAIGNELLRRDMLLSSVFLGVSLLLVFPTVISLCLALSGIAVILLSDALNMDSRRGVDAAVGTAGSGPGNGVSAERPRTPQQLFHRVAPYYDTLNSAFSLGFDRSWRRRAAAVAELPENVRLLDLATGTGALARAFLRAHRTATVVGCDINTSMLAVARKRLGPEIAAGRCELLLASADRLPFPNQSFDAVSIAFAIDDMPDRHETMREIRRVLRPGGVLILLELSIPDGPVTRRLYLGGLRLFALLGRSRKVGAYAHLRDEIVGYRGAEAIRGLFTFAGLTGHRDIPLTGGIARLHVAGATANASGTAAEPDVSGGNRCR